MFASISRTSSSRMISILGGFGQGANFTSVSYGTQVSPNLTSFMN